MSAAGWADDIRGHLEKGADLLRRTAQTHGDDLADIARLLAEALASGQKLLLCGNGGSAADAQHIATELVARYKRERPALPAIALGSDVTLLSAMGNDYGFEQVFARQVQALGASGDLLWAFSTSGKSPNVLAAAAAARERGLTVIGFTGAGGAELEAAADYCLKVDSLDTAHIQEVHMAAAHAICDLVEQAIGG